MVAARFGTFCAGLSTLVLGAGPFEVVGGITAEVGLMRVAEARLGSGLTARFAFTSRLLISSRLSDDDALVPELLAFRRTAMRGGETGEGAFLGASCLGRYLGRAVDEPVDVGAPVEPFPEVTTEPVLVRGRRFMRRVSPLEALMLAVSEPRMDAVSEARADALSSEGVDASLRARAARVVTPFSGNGSWRDADGGRTSMEARPAVAFGGGGSMLDLRVGTSMDRLTDAVDGFSGLGSFARSLRMASPATLLFEVKLKALLSVERVLALVRVDGSLDAMSELDEAS